MVRVRQSLGKYRIEQRLAEGGFAAVYRARDTVEGIPVALKIPHAHLMTKSALDDFRREVRLTAKLDHPNILPIKNAGFIDDKFVIVYPLGRYTLGERLHKRLAIRTAMSYTEQMLEALAYAHSRGVMHLDIKPDNFIIFDTDRVRLTDFGIARVAQRTIQASGAGTVGYIAPEQAMGKPSRRSDVFALALILYRMFSGKLPEWPFEWPPPGYDRAKRVLNPRFIAIIRRAMAVDHRDRYADAQKMLRAYRRIRSSAIRRGANGRTTRRTTTNSQRNWKTIRIREFLRQFKTVLDLRSSCNKCGEPVSEFMQHCPWCGSTRKKHRDETKFPAHCPRCRRGVKLDWRFCAWCFGSAIGPLSNREYTDKRYTARCTNRSCKRKSLMPFMKYCPWCRTKVRKKWPIEGSSDRCHGCGHGVVREYWEFCPWCGRSL